MNTPINDGGPAFGRVVSKTFTSERTPLTDSCTHIDTIGGMTLRDWFAGQADSNIANWIVQEESEELIGRPYPKGASVAERFRWSCDVTSALRYIHADAMLAARDAKQEAAK